jgi:hypothetical protein
MVNMPGTTVYGMNLPIPMGMGRGRADAGERQGELVGKETVVATWNLKRGHEWAELRSALPVAARSKSTVVSSPGEQPKVSTAK